MIESGFGRTDPPELGHSNGRTRAVAEAGHRDVREPWPPFAPVHPQALEPPGKAFLEERRMPALVVEDEHGHSLGLAVAGRHENRLGDPGGGLPKRFAQGVQLFRRPLPEKRERDVQVVDGQRPRTGVAHQHASRPAGQLARGLGRNGKTEEQPQPLMATEASSAIHADGTPDRARTRRM